MSQLTENLLSAQLDAGERLLWSGQPRGGIRLRGQDLFLIPFSLVWGGFAIFWETMAVTATSRTHSPVAAVFPLFGAPFVIVGIYLIFGRFFVDAWMRARTYYGVTNERVIIMRGLFSRQTKSLQLRTLTDVSLTERDDGSGRITFGPTFYRSGFCPGGEWPAGRYTPPAFDQIERAKEVYDIIRSAQRAAVGG